MFENVYIVDSYEDCVGSIKLECSKEHEDCRKFPTWVFQGTCFARVLGNKVTFCLSPGVENCSVITYAHLSQVDWVA